jgi:N-terminal region of glycosyl transferase group 7
VDQTANVTWPDLYTTVGRQMLIGGEWRPPGCTAITRLAVIIPCRDRDQHLRILLRHLIPILQRQQVHFRIFVVEQVIIPSLFQWVFRLLSVG